jgi:Mrp family chromosome partitioning ATPase
VKARADLVVLDSPPILAVADTSAIAGQVDGIVVVVAKGTPLKTLEEVRERLEFVGTPVLGYVFNRADTRAGSYGYGYGYGYGGSPPTSR